MSIAEKRIAESQEKAPSRAWLVAVVAWFLPGGGHLLERRLGRAAILGATIWACFLAGLAMGGRMFGPVPSEQGWSALLQIPPMIANLGTGVLYIAAWLVNAGFSDDAQQAARATFEYGNTFLLVAGLLNYLAMLDAFDIAAGRKS